MEKRIDVRQTVEPIELIFEMVECGENKLENVLIFIEEVSLHGIRFRTKIEFAVNDTIRFSLPSIGVQSIVEGRIAWKKHSDDDQCLYGLYISKE